MESRRSGILGTLKLSPLGIGCWAMGGDAWSYGWGVQNDADSIAAIHRAVERGINWLDTAPVYGLGHSEVVVARALASLSKSERPYIFSKCGIVWNQYGKIRHQLSSASIFKEVEGSLRRLSVETIDCYQIHWPAYPPGALAPDIEEAWHALLKLKEEGKIRYVGVSNFDVSQLQRLQAIGKVESVQSPYSLLKPEIQNELLPFCKLNDAAVFVYSPMASGLLSGKMTRKRISNLTSSDWRKSKSLDFRDPLLTQHLKYVDKLSIIGSRYGCVAGVIAIAWTLHNSAVTGAIVGVRSEQQLKEIIDAARLCLSEDDVTFLSPSPSSESSLSSETLKE